MIYERARGFKDTFILAIVRFTKKEDVLIMKMDSTGNTFSSNLNFY